MTDSGSDLAAVYDRRFAGEAEFRSAMWRVLCREFFQKYVDAGATVLEVGAGHCEFINNIAAARRILQPNIRFCYRDYWMFFDHITPLDDRSLSEALRLAGFEPGEIIERFLPFTTKSSLPKSLTLLRIYLKIPLLWRLFGAQSFFTAHPRIP
ncbi:MAG TPA: hypothetical protein VG106_10065 [Vicinamibacterales bacterium]|nr:hypothetical protein [Vicinamibacterales bacterium]